MGPISVVSLGNSNCEHYWLLISDVDTQEKTEYLINYDSFSYIWIFQREFVHALIFDQLFEWSKSPGHDNDNNNNDWMKYVVWVNIDKRTKYWPLTIEMNGQKIQIIFWWMLSSHIAKSQVSYHLYTIAPKSLH